VTNTAQILRISPDEYHQRPGFSASCAKTLIERSPLHAWSQHPLYGAKGKKPTKEMDFGTVGHTLVLGKGKRIETLDYDNFLTKDAKADRDAARAAGKVPVLTKDHNRATAAAQRVTEQLADLAIKLDGESELAIEWTEETEHGPVLCRCMFDHVWLSKGRVLDLKFTGNASPSVVERNAENMGYAIQEAAYRRALTALDPSLAGRVDFLFGFAETEDPYALNVCRGDGLFRELGERRWSRALTTWAECVKNGKWPGFSASINPLNPPAWAFKREEEAA
jgi:PDDEXK-like domain of unknown function (DUF3799)